MARYIPAEGPSDAKIVLIGESPWKTEDAVGRPFVGASGNLLKMWWDEVGLLRSQIHIDNVYPYKPKAYDAGQGKLDAVPPSELVPWMENLHHRIASLESPRVIVPTGNYALFALTGKGNVKASVRKAVEGRAATAVEKKVGITSVRGSVYEYTDMRGRKMWVVPTIHPAAVLNHMKWEPRSIADWKRIKKVAEEGARIPERTHFINPSRAEVQYVLDIAQNPRQFISIDIETWGRTLSCVGFSWNSETSVVVPTVTPEQKADFMPLIKAICESPCEKIFHNGLYDTYWLAQEGIKVVNWRWDTLCMHHALDPAESHSLQYLASILTMQPYWKDEAKDADEIKKYAKDLDALWVYNGLDCCVTMEIYWVLRYMLERNSAVDFYLKHYAALFPYMLETMLHGVRVDAKGQKAMAKVLKAECDRLRLELKEAAGGELYATERKSFYRDATSEEVARLWPAGAVGDMKHIDRAVAKEIGYVMTKRQVRDYTEKLKKDFSGKKLYSFLYETLGAPVQRDRKTKKPTTDETALRTLAVKYPAKVGKWPLKILKHREKKKEINYVRGSWDSDERLRCSYKLQTEAGRMASAKNPKGRGYNLQNVKLGDIRKTFLPDNGCVFVRVDLSQVEDRQVKMLTGAERMVEMANLRPSIYDAHTENAAVIFGVSASEVTKDQRYLGKRAVHASQRGMHGRTLSEKLLEDEYTMTPKQCQELIDRYLDANWEIRDSYFPWVRQLVQQYRMLVNTWGRVIHFHDRLGDDVYRRAYSFLPQSETADLLNQWGFLAVCEFIHKGRLLSRPNLQVHDEVVVSCPPEEAYIVALFLVKSLERPRFYKGAKLCVPAEVTVGANWDEGHEWKEMPGRREFEEVVYDYARTVVV